VQCGLHQFQIQLTLDSKQLRFKLVSVYQHYHRGLEKAGFWSINLAAAIMV